MRCSFSKTTRSVQKWTAVLTVVAAAGVANMSAGRADEADAKRLFKAMSDYLGAQKAMLFDYDVNLELVSTQQQKIGLASSGTVTLNRPDKLHLTRTNGFANVEMVFDGKTLTLLGKNTNLYTQIEAPGTIDQLVDLCGTSTTGPSQAPNSKRPMENIMLKFWTMTIIAMLASATLVNSAFSRPPPRPPWQYAWWGNDTSGQPQWRGGWGPGGRWVRHGPNWVYRWR